jgi:hypothetical protein
MAQKERKKAFKNIFLAQMQILVKCFDLVSLHPGGIFWTTDITPSNFYSGTSANGWGPRAPRRLCGNITVPGKAEGRQNVRCLMALAGPPRRGPAGSVTRDQSKGID